MYKFKHNPVLLDKAINSLNLKKNKIYVDATFGSGSYAQAILQKIYCKVIAIDCDQTTGIYANALKNIYKNRFTFVNKNFTEIDKILKKIHINRVNGIIFDLGISSMQIDNNFRGFSFNSYGFLDMRMDSKLFNHSAVLINSLYEKELSSLIYDLSGEKKSYIFAQNIIKIRKNKQIKSIDKLVNCAGIQQYVKKIYFITRTFQALRIAVNNELQSIKLALNKLPPLLVLNGIICIVSFHSLEDKIVKNVFKNLIIKKKFIKIEKQITSPLYKEIINNPRSRSAKLRCLYKII